MRCPSSFSGRHTHCSCWGRQPVLGKACGVLTRTALFPFAFQSPLPRRIAPTAAVSPVTAGDLGKVWETIRFTRRTERNIPMSRYGSGDREMEHSKLANGNGHRAQIGRSASPAQEEMSTARSAGKKKKIASRKAKLVRPPRKKTGSESKSNGLVCRYCGSEDLAPSFIKRRDRRCRKCFSKRYGSAARTRKAKVRK
jgi:hypothetical protein